MNATRRSISCLSLSILLGIGIFAAPQQDDNTKKKDDKKKTASAQRETVAKPMTEKERKRKEEKLRKELETPYRKWLNEDVAYIITDEERAAFKRLQTDDERENFIENFWLRRDPTPDTVENEFKEEHYRRIAYANENFASGIPGWKTDRGRIYITYGPPDEKESHPSGGSYERPPEEGGGTTSTFPFEQWRYRYIEGIGTNIIIEFVDPTMSGEYHMTMDPSEKDALLYVPGAGLTMMEQLGLSSKTDRFNRTDGTHLGVPFGAESESMNEFNRLEQFAKLQRPPAVKFKDLEAAVSSRISYSILPMKVRADFFPLTDASVLTFVTLQFENKDLQFQNKEGVQKAVVNIFGKVSTMTRRIVTTFEDTVTVDSPQEYLQQISQRKSIYNKSVPLAPGTYRLNVVAKDVVGGNLATYEVALNVPRMDAEKLTASNIVLADMIEHVPTKSIGMGQFVIGTSKVRPRVDDVFKREEKMGIYFKIYNFGSDGDSHMPTGEVTYEVVKNGTNEKIFEVSEDVAKIPGASVNQVTIEKLLPLNTLAPGQYTLRVKITDKNRNQVLTPSAQFTVT
ncbi:MAG TPA: GWxTD domain-containing protein [Candidatus Acidoferrales bacterium]|nr:GWxTD domain-containing protein [Candidatus Acidoferrales bacterium]